MTDSNYTHILAIVDRSGSMSWGGVAKEMTHALDKYFEGQAEVEGKCLVDYVQFDTVYEKVFEDTPVVEAKAVIQPRGGTALLDAIGRGTVELGTKLKRLPEHARPGTVLVVVVTDGQENSSVEYSAEKVKALINKQEDKYSWEYFFLGANIDAVATGDQFGFKRGNTLTFDINNAQAVSATMDSLAVSNATYRSGGTYAFSDEEREAAVGK